MTWITAHSGSDGTPDNTLEYVDYALTCGADAFECDVRRDSRNGLYLSHDEGAAVCPGLAAVFERMALLDIRVNCDLKEAGLEQAVLELAGSFGIENRLIFSGTVAADLLKTSAEIRKRTFWNIEEALPEIRECYRQKTQPGRDVMERVCARYRECRATVVNIHYGLCTPENLKLFKENGLAVSIWTVNESSPAVRFLNEEVMNITTRKPKLLLSLRNDQKRGI